MKLEVSVEQCQYFYKMIDFQDIPYEKILSSKDPKTVILAILGNRGEAKAVEVLKKTTQRLIDLPIETKTKRKLLTVMTILGRLRTDEQGIELSQTITQITKDMPIEFDVTKDKLFKEGQKTGKEQGIEIGIEQEKEQSKIRQVSRLLRLKLPVDQIMLYADVDEDFVKMVAKKPSENGN